MKTKLKDFQSIYKEALKQCGLPDLPNRQQCLILTKSYEKPKPKKSLYTDSEEPQSGHMRNFSSEPKKMQTISKGTIWQKKYSLNSLKGSNGFGKLANLRQITQESPKLTLNWDQNIIKISTQVSLSTRQNDKSKLAREKLALIQQYNSNNLKGKNVRLKPLKSNWKQWQKQQLQDINDFIQFVNTNKGRQSKSLFYQKNENE